MFKIRGKLLRANVLQKTVQSRSIYSARGGEPPPPWLRPLGLKQSRHVALVHRSWKKNFFLLVAIWREFRVQGFDKCRSDRF